MAGVTLKMVNNKALTRLNEMIENGMNPASFLNRVVYPEYQRAQQKRWMSEGESQGSRWHPLNEEYRWLKEYTMADMPGGGTKMMIATGRLIESVTGLSVGANPSGIKDHRKAVSINTLVVGTSVEYAEYAAIRPFMNFSPAWRKIIKQKYSDYMMGRVK
jgi:hypothetical protein